MTRRLAGYAAKVVRMDGIDRIHLQALWAASIYGIEVAADQLEEENQKNFLPSGFPNPWGVWEPVHG